MKKGDEAEENEAQNVDFIAHNGRVKEEELADSGLFKSFEQTDRSPSCCHTHPFTRQYTRKQETILQVYKPPNNVPYLKSKPFPRCFKRIDHHNIKQTKSQDVTEVKSMMALKAKSMHNVSKNELGQMSDVYLGFTNRPDFHSDVQKNDSITKIEELKETIETSNNNQNYETSNTLDCVSNEEACQEESEKMAGNNDRSWQISVSKKVTVDSSDPKPLSMTHSCTTKHILNSEIYKNKLKIKSLIKIIEKDREAVDLKISLFMSASSKDPMNLYPFPNIYFEDNEASRHLVNLISEEIPSVDMFLFLLRERAAQVKKEMVAFIKWLIKCEDPRLESVSAVEGKRIMEAISHIPADKMPPKIFRIKNKRNSETEVLWDQVRRDYPTKFAYCRCKVEEAHTVLRYGLHNHMDKYGSFGTGIYLTDDLSRCVNLSKPGLTWGKSIMASKIKLIFISEFVCNHNVIEYDQTNGTSQSPFKSYFLKKPVLVRLRYLLVYLTEPSTLPKTPFVFSPMRTKMLMCMNVVRCALVVMTVVMGMAARKNAKSPTNWMIENAQHYIHKVSSNINQWSIWNYIDTHYFNFITIEPGPQLSVE